MILLALIGIVRAGLAVSTALATLLTSFFTPLLLNTAITFIALCLAVLIAMIVTWRERHWQ
jgi:small basic protein